MKKLLLLIMFCINCVYCICASKYYLCQTTTTLNLRTGPSSIYDKVCTIPRGGFVVIEIDDNREYNDNDFVYTLYVDSNKYGFVSFKFLKVLKEMEIDSSGVLTKVGDYYGLDPQIEITNKTLRDITIQVNNATYQFGPEEKRTITCEPGKIKVKASTKGVLPFICTDNVEENAKYTWVFYVE